ncbi:MAG TPA: fatty acid desaturase, partial [Pirellulales bacterium]
MRTALGDRPLSSGFGTSSEAASLDRPRRIAVEKNMAQAPTVAPKTETTSSTSANASTGSSVPSPAPKKHPRERLAAPEAATPLRIRWTYLVSIIVVHGLACLAFLPSLFSWAGVVIAFLGLYVFGTLGINLCYHRLLTHTGLKTPKWLEHSLATLGVCCLEDAPARWVAIHRLHHQFSDERPDPHSPLVNFFWGHFGWIVVENRFVESLDSYDKYAKDLIKDPFYRKLERRLNWLWVYLAHAALFFVVGMAAGWLMYGDVAQAAVFGSSILVWGVFVRTVAVWHITWSVNSLSHVWGYRNYETSDDSRNNWFVALISNGEGWHNNHHHDQRSAAHGHRWWEFDVTYLTI